MSSFMRRIFALALLALLSIALATAIAIVVSRYIAIKTHFVTNIPKDSLTYPSPNAPKYYYEPKPNSTSSEKPDWLPYTATYTYNNEGFNTAANVSADKPDHVFRIIALGDSFTFGQYVNTADNYPSLLDTRLNSTACTKQTKFEVLNLGMSGYDLQYAVERFARHGQPYHPDLVIWLINDFNLLQIHELLTPLEQTIIQNTTDSSRQKYYAENDYYFARIQATADLQKKYGQANILDQQKQFLARLTSVYPGPLALFMFTAPMTGPRTIVRDYIAARKNSYFAELPNLTDTSLFPDGHPSKIGQTAIADGVYTYLTSHKLVPCP